MKRCPKCEFVYEDDTNACEMDGSFLLHCSQMLPPLEKVMGTPASAGPSSAWRWPQWRTIAFPTLAAAILLTVLFVTYYVVAQRSPTGPPMRSSAEATTVAPAAAIDAATVPTSSQPTPASAQPLANEGAPSSATDKPIVPARLNSGPVSAAGGSGRGPVIIRFADGRSIKADEAWERKEGIWYRQAGVVTFLKRGHAKVIVTGAPAKPSPAKATARKPIPQPAKPKEESRIGSLLKKTGRILKRPFKL